jgi:hypothetical protein
MLSGSELILGAAPARLLAQKRGRPKLPNDWKTHSMRIPDRGDHVVFAPGVVQNILSENPPPALRDRGKTVSPFSVLAVSR